MYEDPYEPEPIEGWERKARRLVEEFDDRIASAREVGEGLYNLMTGASIEDAPLWHLGFLFHFRAKRLGPETAAADRARAGDRGWARLVWDEAGELRPLWRIDEEVRRLARAEWRRQVGLPDGVAEELP